MTSADLPLKLLGIPSYQGEKLPLEHPLLLLTYLSAHEAWIPRNELLDLLFEDDDEAVARNKLRQLLFRAKKLDWFAGFTSNPQHLKHEAESDLRAFRKAIEGGDWESAVQVYGGQLLKDSPVSLSAYENWLESERADLETSFLEAASWHSEALASKNQHVAACQLLRNVLGKDPLNEELMQGYLAYALNTEDKAEAIELYGQFKNRLGLELNMQPLPATVDLANALIESINQEKLQTLMTPAEKSVPTLLHAPKGLSSFVGRDPELAHLISLLEQTDSHLISLLGIGGIGKTRLALAAAQEFVKGLKDGGYFVALTRVNEASLVADELLKTLGLEPDLKQSAEQQVISYLKEKELLLLLDNFEHLMGATDLIQNLMTHCPRLKLLITSRERLNLSQEQVFEISGLSLPAAFDDTLPLEAYDGIGLFLRSARKNSAQFNLNEDNREAIFELCHTLEGVPLALELAASWLRLMDVREVLAETRKSFDLIESDFADLPSRHQSLRAVFESSWQLLSSDEQTCLVALSVFVGGFSLEAARTVTGSSPRTLLKLVNKSLIRRDQSGRFELLEVIRQYAYEQLLAEPQRLVEIKKGHAAFFATLAEASQAPLAGGPTQRDCLNQLEADHANLRKALEHFLATNDLTAALAFTNSLFPYWFIRGHWQELEQFSEKLLHHSPDHDQRTAFARQLAHTGYLRTLRGYYETASELLNQSLELLKDSSDLRELAQTLAYLGISASYQNDYDKAQQNLLESLSLLKNPGEALDKAFVLHELGNLYLRQDHLLKAKAFYDQALELREKNKDHRGAARTLSNLGIVARRQGDYEEAETRYRQGLLRSRDINDRLGIADSLNALGVLAKANGHYQEARTAYQESLDLYKRCGDSLGEAVSLENFGILCRLEHSYLESKRFFELCLANHKNRGDRWGMARALSGLGLGHFHLDETETALKVLNQGLALAQSLDNQQILTQNLLALAYVLSFSSVQEAAVQVLAYATQRLERSGSVLTPVEQKQVHETEQRLRKNFTAQAFEASWQRGQTLASDAIAELVSSIDGTKLSFHPGTA